jgi:hypothetical protein
VRYAGRDLIDRVESLQLLDFSFGDLPLFDFRTKLPVGLLQFARSTFNAALERLSIFFRSVTSSATP